MLRSIERRFPRQHKVRHPFVQPRTNIRSPQKPPGVLKVQSANAALGLQHFACSTINFPADVECQLRLHAHGSSREISRTNANAQLNRTFPSQLRRRLTVRRPVTKVSPVTKVAKAAKTANIQ